MIGFNSNRGGEEHNNAPLENNSNSTDPIPNPPQTQPAPQVRYGECLKNHAANVGRHVTDGCGEFMSSDEEPLKCTACGCHRSFHRREAEGSAEPSANTAPYYPYNLAHRAAIGHLVQHPPLPPPPAAPPTTTPQHRYGRAGGPPLMMAFGGGAAADSSSEDMEMIRMSHDGGGQSASRKRFRTKFTPEQKGRMREFAERIGWKIQKQNEAEVQQFCAEAGVKRQVFKVWMHNCNQASKKKQS